MRCLSLGILGRPKITKCNFEITVCSTEQFLTLTYPPFQNVSARHLKRSVLTECHGILYCTEKVTEVTGKHTFKSTQLLEERDESQNWLEGTS